MSIRIGVVATSLLLGSLGLVMAQEEELVCSDAARGRGAFEDCNANGVSDECDLRAASFRGLGVLPGGAVSSKAFAVSSNGSVVVGSSGSEAFRWTSRDGMIGLGVVPGSKYSEALDVSADGSVVVGRSLDTQAWGAYGSEAFRWTDGFGMESLGHLARAYTAQASGVSADGSVVVGWDCSYGSCEAFRWTSVDGMVGLGNLDGVGDSYATGVSADGSIVVGNGTIGRSGCICLASGGCWLYDPFLWTSDGGLIALGFPPRTCFGSWANAISANGLVVVGSTADEPVEALRWTSASGVTELGEFPGGKFYSSARSVSGKDGAVVVGASEGASGIEAFLWDATNGMRSLRSVLVDDYGLDLTGWTLTSARDISEDGRTIVGYGINPDGATEAWLAVLSRSTDCNGTQVGRAATHRGRGHRFADDAARNSSD